MKDILNFELLGFLGIETFHLTVGSVLLILLGYAIIRVLLVVSSKGLKSFFRSRKVDVGRSHTIIQFINYAAYLIFIIFALNILGIKLNYFLTGSAALLVGIGIGLQQTFNDMFSGFILLMEGTVEVGDQLKINNLIGTVKYIGIRTSKIETVDRHVIIMPNSRLVGQEVINLSHLATPVRFNINIPVNYGADFNQIEEIILKVMENHPPPIEAPQFNPTVTLQDFKDSHMNVRMYFYTNRIMFFERVKGDIRKDIYKAFNDKGIKFPFPKRDIWIKSEVSENASSINKL